MTDPATSDLLDSNEPRRRDFVTFLLIVAASTVVATAAVMFIVFYVLGVQPGDTFIGPIGG